MTWTGPTAGRAAEYTDAKRSGRTGVDVHQVARNLAGEVLWDGCVLHIYEIRDGLVARMDIEEQAAVG